jgi:ribosomal protein L7/L12
MSTKERMDQEAELTCLLCELEALSDLMLNFDFGSDMNGERVSFIGGMLKRKVKKVAAIVKPSNGHTEAQPTDDLAMRRRMHLWLEGYGDSKVAVIKVVKDRLGLGLAEARELVESAPKVIVERMPRLEAETLQAELKAEGATVRLEVTQ